MASITHNAKQHSVMSPPSEVLVSNEPQSGTIFKGEAGVRVDHFQDWSARCKHSTGTLPDLLSAPSTYC